MLVCLMGRCRGQAAECAVTHRLSAIYRFKNKELAFVIKSVNVGSIDMPPPTMGGAVFFWRNTTFLIVTSSSLKF